MRLRSGLMFTLAASLVLGGCAAGGGAAASGPQVSPTGKTYEPGVRPRSSKFTGPATLFIAQRQYDQALEQAELGIAADSTNPQHYFLAGQAHAGLGNYEQADEMFDRAEQIYPAYELEVEPAREAAWAEAFNAGVNAYNAGNMAEATEAWQGANTIFGGRAESHQNLAAVYTQEGDYDQAIEAYRAGLQAAEWKPQTRELTAEEQAERAEAVSGMQSNLAELLLFTERFADAEALYRQQLQAKPDDVGLQSRLAAAIASQPGREAEAQEIYNRLLGMPNLSAEDYANIGVALFNAKNYSRAAEAFGKVAEARPNSRDAWYNYANALYAAEDWARLVPVAQKLVVLDPANEDTGLIMARAYKDTDQNQKALGELERLEALPVKVKDLQMRLAEGKATVRGKAIGNRAAAGTPVQVRFVFFGDNGQEIGTQTVSVSAPAKDAEAEFEAVLETATTPTGYRYEIVR